MLKQMAMHSARERWRRTRLPVIEATAYGEIMRFERRFGAVTTPVIPVDSFLEDLWGLRYVHCDPAIFGIPHEAQGGLRVDLRKVIISDAVTHQGQQNMLKLHEGCHWVVHVPAQLRVGRDQGRLLEVDAGSAATWYCRGEVCYRDGQLEEPYMYREAEFFGACMLLPRDRFTPRAERRIQQAWREVWRGHPFPGPEWFRLVGARAIPPVLERAVHLLHEQHQGEVSKTVIRIRLAEVGWAPQFSQQRPDQDMSHLRDVLPAAVEGLCGPLSDAAGTGAVVGARPQEPEYAERQDREDHCAEEVWE